MHTVMYIPYTVCLYNCRYKVVQSCWQTDPHTRPTFTDVVSDFTGILAAMAEYFDFTLATNQATSAMW